MTRPFDYDVAFERNLGWVTAWEQQRLRGARVAIAGMGGVGGVHLMTLARLGVGKFNISDFDSFDLANFNRQAGAMMSTLDKPKVDVLTQMAADINPEVEVRGFPEGVNRDNIGAFLDGVDLYVDGLDFFAFDARELLFAECARRAVPAVTAAPVGMGTAVLTFMPGGMTFEEYFRWNDGPKSERALRFLLGLTPVGKQRHYLADRSRVRFDLQRAPSTVMACQMCAGVAATEALKVLLKRGKLYAAPHGLHFDAYLSSYVHTWRPGGNRNPLQRLALAIGRKAFAAATAAPGKPGVSGQQSVIEQIAAAGVLAPSADNHHHFGVRLGADHLELVADAAYLSMRERHRRALTWFSFGAVAENMSVRAAARGLDSQVALLPRPGDPALLARITFMPSGRARALAGMDAAIESRCTNRRMYRGPGPDEDQKLALATEVAAGSSGATLHWLDGPARRVALGLIWLAESERFRRQRLHEELFGAVRFDVGWRASVDEALPPVSLEVERPMRAMFAALRHWRLMRALTFVGAHRMLGLRAAWLPAAQAPALGVVTMAGADDAAFYAAGRGFERLWLRATTMGLAMQPLAASAALALQSDSDQGISPAARSSLVQGWDMLFPGRTPAIVFRIGHADEPSGRAGRRPLESYLLRS